MDELIRQKLENRGYSIQRELGRGGFGITYLAREERNEGDLVVIKTIKDELLQHIQSNSIALQRLIGSIDSFRREADTLLKFQHPNIVIFRTSFCENLELQVNQFFNDENSNFANNLEFVFLVMEYIEGKNLQDFLNAKNSPLSEAEALYYIQQIGEALVVIHEKNLLHRDIKPQNIMVRAATNQAVLIDFGISRDFIPEITQSQTVFYTDPYAPPEQLRRRDRRGCYTDIYSLATTLYYLLTKELPISALQRTLDPDESLDEPQKINPDISDRVNQAILWGMKLEPNERPQTVQKWLEKLLSKETSVKKTPPFEPVKLQVFQFEVIRVDAQGREIERVKRDAQYFTENLGKNVTLEMVSIPGGKFVMGSPETEVRRSDNESPQHEVAVPPFFMGKYPITQAQWRAVAALTQVNRKLNPNPSHFKGDNLPVEQIIWYEAVEFCARLSKYTQRHYQLPSEAEWEYACRAGTTTPFHLGETITPELVNYHSDDTYGSASKKTTPVGSFKVANAFGLYDMHGNVWEWCADNWHDNYEGAPTDGSAWIKGDENIGARVLRGSSWYHPFGRCPSVRRSHGSPDNRFSDIGFRVLLTS